MVGIDRACAALAVGLLLAVVVCPSSGEGATLTRTSGFDYEVSGLLKKEIVEPGDTNLCLVTEYTYDGYGNKTGTTTRNCNGASYGNGTQTEAGAPSGDAVIVSRGSSATYAAGSTSIGGTTYTWLGGQFATTVANALSHGETKVYDPRFGTVRSLTGPNGLTTSWEYDGFGRKVLETRSDGTKTAWAYLLCTSVSGGTESCPTVGGAVGKTVVRETPQNAGGTQNGPITKTYFDMLGREIRVETQGFDGGGSSTAIYRDTYYDSLGRVWKMSPPYYASAPIDCAGTPSACTVRSYDVLGRVTAETQPATGAGTVKTATSYNGLTVTVTVSNDGSGTNLPEGVSQTRTTVKNAQGQTVSVTDAQGHQITYAYDPFGNLKQTQSIAYGSGNSSSTSTLSYDLRGRKTQMSDPDMGTWTYAYNALGELIRQTDAKSQVTTMVYDVLGRMTQRTEADLTSKWFYDAYPTGAGEWVSSMASGITGDCSRGIGKLCYASADNGYRRLLTYETGTSNVAARPVASRTRLDGTDYTVTSGYDANGRVSQTTYPASNVYTGGFVTKHVYTALGYLQQVTDSAGTTVYWQVHTMSARGEVLTASQGTGVINTTNTHDALGRLTGNTVTGSGGTTVQSHTYTYDTIGNLVTRVDNVQSVTENFAYDRLNRLMQSSGTGLTTRSFDYDALGNIASKGGVGSYGYNAQGTPCAGGAGGGVHAVCAITGTVNGVTNPTFTYDANGNMVAGLNRTLTYTSFNMPATVVQSTNFMIPGTSVTYQYVYNGEHERVKHVISRDDGVYTTLFVHPGGKGALLYEREVKPDASYEHKHYISAGGVLVGVHIAKSDASTQTRYFQKDHLGSLSLITTSAGAVLERLAYDAWGKRRNVNGTEDPSNALYGMSTDRGYTGHEHLDEMALVHMNGRIYDPVIGRFATADPFMQSPDNLQSYNRYAYVLNNPLTYTDPTGLLSFKLGPIKVRISGSDLRQIAGIAVTAWLGFGDFTWLNGSAVGIFGQGTLGTALAAGFGGGLVATGNLEGGLQGAFSAALFFGVGEFVPGAEGSWSKVVGHAVAGCISAEASGGECRHGAVSAGFAQAAGPYLPGEPGSVTRLVARAVVGGTASTLGGGKFSNGAATAAFGYLFNDWFHMSPMVESMARDPDAARASADSAKWVLDLIPGVAALECLLEGCGVIGWGIAAIDALPGGKPAKWTLGAFKSETRWANQMTKRGWTSEQITEAIERGQQFNAVNMVNKGNAATRYVHPQTGQSVVVDNATKEVLHVGGKGFRY